MVHKHKWESTRWWFQTFFVLKFGMVPIDQQVEGLEPPVDGHVSPSTLDCYLWDYPGDKVVSTRVHTKLKAPHRWFLSIQWWKGFSPWWTIFPFVVHCGTSFLLSRPAAILLSSLGWEIHCHEAEPSLWVQCFMKFTGNHRKSTDASNMVSCRCHQLTWTSLPFQFSRAYGRTNLGLCLKVVRNLPVVAAAPRQVAVGILIDWYGSPA